METKIVRTPYEQGYIAGMMGDCVDCPFKENTHEYTMWWHGYNAGCYDALKPEV